MTLLLTCIAIFTWRSCHKLGLFSHGAVVINGCIQNFHLWEILQNFMDVPGQRLSLFADVWRNAGADPALQHLIQFGHKIVFEDGVPPLTMPLLEHETTMAEPQMEIVRTEVAQLLVKGAIRKVSQQEALAKPGHYSHIFTVSKPGGKHRVVINMKPLNEHVLKEKFRMETAKDVKSISILKKGDFGAVVDLTDAYYTVKLHKQSRKYCRFIVDGQIYEYIALPMGLTCSARIFTRVALFISSRLRRMGVRIILYIDDLLVIASTARLCEEHVRLVVDTIVTFGFLLNMKKSNLTPSQVFVYLGMVWDTVNWLLSIKPEREDHIRKNAQELMKSTSVTCRTVAVFLGRTNSAAGAIPLARARCRVLQWDFLASCTAPHLYNPT